MGCSGPSAELCWHISQTLTLPLVSGPQMAPAATRPKTVHPRVCAQMVTPQLPRAQLLLLFVFQPLGYDALELKQFSSWGQSILYLSSQRLFPVRFTVTRLLSAPLCWGSSRPGPLPRVWGSAEKGLNPCRMNEWTKRLSEVTITLSHIQYVRLLFSH